MKRVILVAIASAGALTACASRQRELGDLPLDSPVVGANSPIGNAMRDAGDLERSDSGGAAKEGGDTDVRESFAWIFDRMISVHCVGCHNRGTHGRTPFLERRDAYEQVVGRPSEQLPSMPYVTPGSPERSYFFRKVAGTHGAACAEAGKPASECGLLMPRGGPGVAAAALPNADVATLRKWIEGGARR